MEVLLRDIEIAVRGLVRNPGFSLVAILTLALGIGATTTVFTPGDLTTFTTAATLLMATAAIACLVPSSRATRVDPVVALRAE